MVLCKYLTCCSGTLWIYTWLAAVVFLIFRLNYKLLVKQMKGEEKVWAKGFPLFHKLCIQNLLICSFTVENVTTGRWNLCWQKHPDAAVNHIPYRWLKCHLRLTGGGAYSLVSRRSLWTDIDCRWTETGMSAAPRCCVSRSKFSQIWFCSSTNCIKYLSVLIKLIYKWKICLALVLLMFRIV